MCHFSFACSGQMCLSHLLMVAADEGEGSRSHYIQEVGAYKHYHLCECTKHLQSGSRVSHSLARIFNAFACTTWFVLRPTPCDMDQHLPRTIAEKIRPSRSPMPAFAKKLLLSIDASSIIIICIEKSSSPSGSSRLCDRSVARSAERERVPSSACLMYGGEMMPLASCARSSFMPTRYDVTRDCTLAEALP